MHNYKIIDTIESLNLEISNKNLKAILACEEIDFFFKSTAKNSNCKRNRTKI